MKDGSAHPNGLDWVYTGEDGSGTVLWDYVPRVKFYELGNDPEHRPATDLERIANRYRESLPERRSANAVEILEAARLLYIELYRDCGTEARRQKLVGADLLVRWIEKHVEESLTVEELDRWRAFVVEDLIELGVTRKTEGAEPTVFEIAKDIAARNSWPLGSASSIKDAYYRWKKNPDWLASGTVVSGYRRITQEDLDALK